MEKEIFLNENHEIINETKNFVMMRLNYSYTSNKVVYEKNSNIYLSNLDKKEWFEATWGGSCLSIWNRKDKGKIKHFDLIISHRLDHVIESYKVASASLPEELPDDIKNEILLEEI